jgi:hypothetical protein
MIGKIKIYNPPNVGAQQKQENRGCMGVVPNYPPQYKTFEIRTSLRQTLK